MPNRSQAQANYFNPDALGTREAVHRFGLQTSPQLKENDGLYSLAILETDPKSIQGFKVMFADDRTHTHVDGRETASEHFEKCVVNTCLQTEGEIVPFAGLETSDRDTVFENATLDHMHRKVIQDVNNKFISQCNAFPDDESLLDKDARGNISGEMIGFYKNFRYALEKRFNYAKLAKFSLYAMILLGIAALFASPVISRNPIPGVAAPAWASGVSVVLFLFAVILAMLSYGIATASNAASVKVFGTFKGRTLAASSDVGGMVSRRLSRLGRDIHLMWAQATAASNETWLGEHEKGGPREKQKWLHAIVYTKARIDGIRAWLRYHSEMATMIYAGLATWADFHIHCFYTFVFGICPARAWWQKILLTVLGLGISAGMAYNLGFLSLNRMAWTPVAVSWPSLLPLFPYVILFVVACWMFAKIDQVLYAPDEPGTIRNLLKGTVPRDVSRTDDPGYDLEQIEHIVRDAIAMLKEEAKRH